MSEAIIRPLDIEHDCQKVADLFNESEPSWPGGFTSGLPLTEHNVREWMESERTLVTLVAEADGRLVGFCSFLENTPWPSGQYDSGYLDLLNVHPAYHGRSIGRRLIQATIERSVQEGWVYQTLGTWSANFKSVPAYKKTGHFWRPDTSVWMQNFVPGALQMPLARPFFDRHDWYASYVRVLEQHPDDERWEGMKVYREHWEAEGESLTIWIDREAQAPCAIETGDVLVAAIPSQIEPLKGASVQLNWRILNKGSEPIHAHIHALGADGLKIDHREAFVVPPGLTVEHVAEVKVTDDAPNAKLDGTAPAVRSIITLDHNEVELFSGLRARTPLSVDTVPGALSLAPGVPSEVILQLHSELDAPVSAVCYLIPSEHLKVEGTREETVELDARGHAAIALNVTPAVPGIHTLQVRLVPADAGVQPAKEELTVFAVPAGSVLGQQAGDSVRLETDSVRLTVSARLGTMQLTHIESGLSLLSARPEAGPPYRPHAFDKNHFKLRLEQADGRARLFMDAEPEHFSDTQMHLVLSLAGNGLVSLEQQLSCLGSEPYRGRMVMEGSWDESGSLLATTPLKVGYVQGWTADYPVDADDTPGDPADYHEPWLGVERNGVAAGMAWSGVTARVRHGQRDVRLLSAPLSLERGEHSAMARYAVWTGRGDWRAAREVLMHWAGLPSRSEEAGEPEARGIVRAAAAAPVLATVSDELETVVTVDSAASRIMHGTVTLAGSDGLGVEPARAEIQALSRAHPTEIPVRLKVPARLGRYDARVALELPTMATRSTFQVLRLGSEGRVAVSSGLRDDRPVWTVDNGAGVLSIAPDYGPSVISWTHAGQEQLASSYPTPRGHAWAYPWYGGIQLKLYINDDADSCGNLINEHLEGQATSVKASGLDWTGVRLSGRPERKELHDLKVEMDYLTLPGSPLLRAVLRLTNLRATRQQIMIGGASAFSLGGNPERLVLTGEGVTHRPTRWSTWHTGQIWGVLSDEDTRANVLSVCPQARLVLNDMGSTSREFSLSGKLNLAGNATREVVWYFYLAPDLDHAMAMRGLASL